MKGPHYKCGTIRVRDATGPNSLGAFAWQRSTAVAGLRVVGQDSLTFAGHIHTPPQDSDDYSYRTVVLDRISVCGAGTQCTPWLILFPALAAVEISAYFRAKARNKHDVARTAKRQRFGS